MIKAAKRHALKGLQRLLWPYYFARYRKAIQKGKVPGDALLNALVYHWGNAGWSADPSYLRALIGECLAARHLTILECGSGLTSVLLGVVAVHQSHSIISIEHNREWLSCTRKRLAKCHLNPETVIYCPLKAYGTFNWYDVTSVDLLRQPVIDVVVCDGPPGSTRGGRVGLPYVLKHAFRPVCRVYLDDAHRSSEQSAISQWQRDFHCTVARNGKARHFTTLTFR